MSQFKTEWMTGIFVDPGNVSQLLLANIENLRPIRIDKSQDAVLLSVTKTGDTSIPLLLAANQKNALASVIFNDVDAWLKSERKKLSFADIEAHQEGVYELALTSADGLQSFALEKLELIGNSVVASFQNKTVGADSYKISLGSVNTNVSPLQQIHDPAKMQTDSRFSGLLRESGNPLDDQHFVRPTRPALGHHYYRQPDSSRLYLNNSLSSALPFTDNASAGMQDVVATSAIFQNHDKLPGLSDPNPQPLHSLTTTASGKIVLSVVFSAADTQLGLTAGTTSLLKANPNNTLAKIFLPPVPKRDAVTDFKHG